MAYLNDLQSKRKTKEDQGEEFGERKTSIVRSHAMLLVHCMTAQMTAAIYAGGFGLEVRNKLQKDPSTVFLCLKAKLKMYKYQGFAWQR